jgi:acid phosphatase family membrane protein YuiD
MRALGDVQRKSQTFGEKFRNVERSFTRSGLIITGVVTGFALAINKSVEAALESQRVSRQTVALIESTGGAANIAADEVGKLAEALALKSGVDDEAIQTSLNLLLTFKQVQNVAGEGNDIFNQTAQTVLDLGNVFGSTDSAAVQLGKALSDPIRGVTALRRVGINFTESQREQIKTLVESGQVLDAQ